MKKVRCDFNLPRDLLEMLDEIAEESDITRTTALESILSYALADEDIIDDIFGEAEEEEEESEEEESEEEEED